MPSSNDIAAIQACLSNSLTDFAIGQKAIAAVIGDTPSHYSKSPSLWNAAFDHLAMKAIYLPFDVDSGRVAALLAACKASKRFLGANVTVPHKLAVMNFLNEVDPAARRIGAVNTIARSAGGRLIGHNTDGAGFIESVLQAQPDRRETFLSTFKDMSVLLLGAGGSARAVALHVADVLGGGELAICNRTIEHAASLATEIQEAGRRAVAISEAQLPEYARRAGIIINSTTKGQGGLRKSNEGGVTKLEAYSALAPAQPPQFEPSASATADFDEKWAKAAASDVAENNHASLTLARSIPSNVRFYDLIYHPEETVFLRHARMSGHPTMNGKAMIINQAVIAFVKHICAHELQSRAMDSDTARKQVLEVMYRAW